MKKIITFMLLCYLLFPVCATPDRSVWVIDTLVGLTNNSYVIKQYVYDNMQSHYENRVQVYIIEKDLKTNKIIKNLKVTEYIEIVNYDTGERTRDNRSEDKILEIISNNPELFYNIYYVFPIGLPNGHKERSRLVNNEVSINDGNENITKYQLDDYVKLDASAQRIIEEYKIQKYRILLIEFGEPSFESNYYQKIVVLER